MPLTLDTPAAVTTPPAGPWAGLLIRIADETRVGVDGFRLGTDVVPVPARQGHGHRRLLVATLAHALYQRYYHHHATPHLARGPVDAVDRRPASARGDTQFCRRLTGELGQRYYWENGWRVVERSASGSAVVERADLRLHVTAEELADGDGGPLVRFPADRPWASTGYHVVTGTSGPVQRADVLARVYLHLLPSTAPEVFARLVAALDGEGLPFTAKVLNDPLTFGRPDSAVVYVAREFVPVAVRAAAERGRASSSFGAPVPAFTRTVLPGVAVADDPGPGTSFGQHRCCTIAAGIAAAGPDAGPAGRLAAVVAALAGEGLDVSALHLNPGRPEFDLGRL